MKIKIKDYLIVAGVTSLFGIIGLYFVNIYVRDQSLISYIFTSIGGILLWPGIVFALLFSMIGLDADNIYMLVFYFAVSPIINIYAYISIRKAYCYVFKKFKPNL